MAPPAPPVAPVPSSGILNNVNHSNSTGSTAAGSANSASRKIEGGEKHPEAAATAEASSSASRGVSGLRGRGVVASSSAAPMASKSVLLKSPTSSPATKRSRRLSISSDFSKGSAGSELSDVDSEHTGASANLVAEKPNRVNGTGTDSNANNNSTYISEEEDEDEDGDDGSESDENDDGDEDYEGSSQKSFSIRRTYSDDSVPESVPNAPGQGRRSGFGVEVYAPSFTLVPNASLKATAVGCNDADDGDFEEEDISDETILAKHDFVLSRMAERWALVSTLKKELRVQQQALLTAGSSGSGSVGHKAGRTSRGAGVGGSFGLYSGNSQKKKKKGPYVKAGNNPRKRGEIKLFIMLIYTLILFYNITSRTLHFETATHINSHIQLLIGKFEQNSLSRHLGRPPKASAYRVESTYEETNNEIMGDEKNACVGGTEKTDDMDVENSLNGNCTRESGGNSDNHIAGTEGTRDITN